MVSHCELAHRPAPKFLEDALINPDRLRSVMSTVDGILPRNLPILIARFPLGAELPSLPYKEGEEQPRQDTGLLKYLVNEAERVHASGYSQGAVRNSSTPSGV